jgi:hypothetical protein
VDSGCIADNLECIGKDGTSALATLPVPSVLPITRMG